MKAIEIKELINLLSESTDEVLERINICVALDKDVDDSGLGSTKFLDVSNITMVCDGSMPPKLLIHCKDDIIQ